MQCGRLAGTEKVTYALILELQALGYRCDVVTLEPMEGLGGLLDAKQIPWVGFDFRRLWGIPAMIGLLKVLFFSRPDVAVQVGHRLVTTAALSFFPGVWRVYQCMHHNTGVKRGWVWRGYYWVVSLVFDRVTFLTEWAKHETIEYCGRIAKNAVVIYPPVHSRSSVTQQEKLEIRERLGLPKETIILGAAGRLVPVKRFDYLLRIYARVARQREGLKLVIAGEGEMAPSLITLAERLGVSGSVIWLPWQMDVESVYRALDCFMYASEIEAFGLVPCEAIANGVPALWSAIDGGPGEVLGSSSRSGQMDPRDEDAASKVVLEWLDMPSGEKRLLLESLRANVASRCAPGVVAERFYTTCLESKHRAI